MLKYERYLGDIARDTSHLTMQEYGAYALLMDWYYANECGIPVDKVCKICRATTPQQRRISVSVAREFFSESDGRFIHKRIEKEIAKYYDKSEKSATSARLRWDKERHAKALPTDSDGNASQSHSHNQSTNTLSGICSLNAIKAVKDIDFSQWPSVPTNPTMIAWIRVRKTKRLTVTQPAMDMIIPELRKAQLAGFSAESCIWYAAAKSWGGFRFAWMQRDMLSGNNPPDMPENLLAKLNDRSWAEGFLPDPNESEPPE